MIKAYAIAAVLTTTSPIEISSKEEVKAPIQPSQAQSTQVIVSLPSEPSIRKRWGGRYGPR
jgi:hypothetical protein